MHAIILLALAAPPADVVQTHDLGTMTWQRAKALGGRRVRVRFVVRGPLPGQVVVVVMVDGPKDEGRYVTLPTRDIPALERGAQLEAEGVLRVEWRRNWAGTH